MFVLGRDCSTTTLKTQQKKHFSYEHDVQGSLWQYGNV